MKYVLHMCMHAYTYQLHVIKLLITNIEKGYSLLHHVLQLHNPSESLLNLCIILIFFYKIKEIMTKKQNQNKKKVNMESLYILS